MLKARPQARMAFNQNLGCPFQSRPVERPLQCQRQLHDVDVRRTHIVKRMEQQPLLQRRQRQNVFDVRVLAFDPLDLVLREPQQRKIAWAATTGTGLLGMAHH